MAERRMFTKKITDDDNFTSMSSSAQALYFHLNQGADDDGFTNQISMAMFKAHASEDDLKVLLAKNYVIRFESGVLVIKHWRMHNTLRKDRYTPTNYQEELELLGIKKNGAYTLNSGSSSWLPSGCQVVAKFATLLFRVGSVRLYIKRIEFVLILCRRVSILPNLVMNAPVFYADNALIKSKHEPPFQKCLQVIFACLNRALYAPCIV